jgi:ATP-dependent RNA helicase DeaD
MVSVEFNRFINYYKKTRDLSSQSSGSDRRERDDREPRENNNGGATRYFVNIGSRDNFDWMSLKDYLKETLDLGRDDVFKVDVKEGFSFFNTDPEHTDKVMEILNNVQLEGRRINVEISKNDGGGRRDHNGRSSGGFGGGRSGGDRGSAPRREGNFAPRREGGFRSDRGSAPREGGFGGRSESRNASAPRTGGFSDRSPRREGGSSERPVRRSENFGDTPREKRPRRS